LLKNLIRRKGTISGKAAPIFIKARQFPECHANNKKGDNSLWRYIIFFYSKKVIRRNPLAKIRAIFLLERLRTHKGQDKPYFHQED
jgi:hypothetical protein